MTLPNFALRSESDRSRAINFLQRVDLNRNLTWTMREAARSDEANRKMWAMLQDISRQVIWHGQRLAPEDWKHVLSAVVEKQRMVPSADGQGFVVLGTSTRRKSNRWFSEMFAALEWFGAEHGVKFTIADRWGFNQ